MIHRVGIIGYGVMGKIRHKVINELGNIAKVVAISEQFSKVENIDIPNLTPEELINQENIDVVIVCTPNHLNKEFTIKALNAGKHVFCEKPPAFTGADVLEIIATEKASNKKLMYGFNHRHHDSIIHMKELISGGEYGNPLWARGRYGKSVTPDYFNQWRSQSKFAGGGILMDQGIHMLDLFLYLLGDFDTVKAELSNLYWKMDVEDNAFVIMKDTRSGVIASLHSTMTQWRHLFSLEIFLEKGYMVLNGLITSSMTYGEEELSIAKNRSTAPAATWKDEIKTRYTDNNSWRYEMEHFFSAIDNDKPIQIGNSDDAFKLMSLMDKIYLSKNT